MRTRVTNREERREEKRGERVLPDEREKKDGKESSRKAEQRSRARPALEI
jgi:hypothetical protein